MTGKLFRLLQIAITQNKGKKYGNKSRLLKKQKNNNFNNNNYPFTSYFMVTTTTQQSAEFLNTHTKDVCVTWERVVLMSLVSVASGLRAQLGSAGSELTEASQITHTHVYVGPCELCISKTFPTCLLCVTHSLWGTSG